MDIINEDAVRKVGYTLAGYYASQCENDGGNFCSFGADAIRHCNEYIDIVNEIKIPYITIDGAQMINTEDYRNSIYNAIFERYGNED